MPAAIEDLGDKVERRLDNWRLTTFGPADEQPFRRRTSDWIRVLVAVVLLGYLIAGRTEVGSAQQALFRFFNQLPNGFEDLFRLLYGAGTLWALGLVLVAALVGRRWRLARDLAVSGIAAWFLSRVIGAMTAGGLDAAAAAEATVRIGNSSPSFPTVRLAVIVAVVATAAPYVTRPTRRVGQAFAVVMAVAAMYLGVGLPNAVVAAAVLGWGVAAVVHLAFGSPGGRPTLPQMTQTLLELGVHADDLRLVEHQPADATLMAAHDDHGDLLVRVLGRDEGDAQVLGRAWRTLLYKSPPGRLHLTRIEEVEHIGYTVLRADHAGVRVPGIVVTGTAGPGAAVYVERPVDGTPLSELPPDQLTEGLLELVWREVTRLHQAGIAHLDLTPDHVLITADGPALVEFSESISSDPKGFWRNDVAALLVGTAELVGADRAVAAAAFGLGRERLTEALPLIQTAVLPSSMKPHGRADRTAFSTRLDHLRSAAAAAVDEEPPHLTELHRVSGANLAMAIGTFLGIAALLSQVGSPQELWDTMSQADWWWIGLATTVSMLTNFATAIALMGSVPIRIPLGRTTELQLSLSFANLAVPTVGGLASQVRYLQKQGVDLASAVAAGGVVSGVANVVVTSAVCLVALFLSPKKVEMGSISASSILMVLLIAALVIGVLSAILFGIPSIRKKVLAPVHNAWETISSAMRSPRQISELVLGWAANALMYGFVLYCCVAAFGAPVNFWTIVLINTGISTLAFAVPVPGGATAVSSVGIAGALTAAGASQNAAVAASLAYQVTATFIPAVPGWFAFRNLMDLDYL